MKTIDDLTGMVFERLTIINRDPTRGNGLTYWNCKCLCGNIKSIESRSLTRGLTKSCGCLKKEKAKLNVSNRIGQPGIVKEDLSGRIFGKLRVVQRDMTKIGIERGSFWICQCECGRVCSTARHSLVNHGTKSCGCLVRESAASRAIPNGGSDKNSWLAKYKRRAIRMNTVFALTNEEFYDICSMNCFYCDIEPTPKGHGYKTINDIGSYRANGIDRIDPSIGYTKENSVPCCKICNFMKTNKTQEDFITKIFQISDNLRRKNGI